jgi:catechol 2,3-dioxygenase
MPYRISRLGYVEVRVLDLDDALNHYCNVLGLVLTAREGRHAYLKGWDEKHAYSVILTQADQLGLERMAFRTISPEDLDYYKDRLTRLGVGFDRVPEDYLRGEAIRTTTPSGHVVELYYGMEYTGNVLPAVNPPPWPIDAKGIATPRLDHCLVTATDPTRTIRWFENVLELKPSEYVLNDQGEPIAAWLWQRPAPHDVAVVPGPDSKFHHVAFAVETPEQVFRACDILTMNKVTIDQGPTRHGITRGTTVYFFDPFGNRNEAFGVHSAYQLDPDHRPICWTQDRLGQGIFYYEQEIVESFLSVLT